jgi:hypothetical protein
MHQIGNSFTRLQPAIEFAESAFTPVPDTLGVLGDPPARFNPVHSQSLLNAWYNKLQNCLADPIQVEQRQGHRRVQILGCLVYDFSPDGQVKAYVWHFDDQDDRIQLAPLFDQSVALQGTPEGLLWMERFQLGASTALQRRHPGKATLCQAYVQWAQKQLTTSCWEPEDQERVRYQAAVALDLDPWVMKIAAQVQITSQPEPLLGVNLYNHVLTHRAGFEILLKEAPGLIALYALMVGEVDSVTDCLEVTHVMRLILRLEGVQTGTWRLLCRVGTDWMREFLAYYDFERDYPCDIAVDIPRLAQAFGTQQLVPPWLLHALMQLGGNPDSPNTRYTKRLDDLFPLCKRLGHLIDQLDEKSLARLQEHAHALFNWASDHLGELPEAYLRRASLGGLIRRVELQAVQDGLALQGADSWHVPYHLRLKSTQVDAVILDSPLAIWQEGQAMRHCADNWIDPCAKGDYLMVSLRHQDKNRPLATVTFDLRGDTVRLHKIAGFANTLASPEARDFAQQCQRQLQVQRQQLHKQLRHQSLACLAQPEIV